MSESMMEAAAFGFLVAVILNIIFEIFDRP